MKRRPPRRRSALSFSRSGSPFIKWFRKLKFGGESHRKAAPVGAEHRVLSGFEPLEPRQLLATYADAVLADNPLGFWQFDEGTGTAPADSTGNGNTGAFVGAPTYTVDGGGHSGMAGDYALDFTPGNRVDITTGATAFDSISTTTDQVTVEFWGFGDTAAQPRTNTTFNLGTNSDKHVAFTHSPWNNSNIYWDAGTNCCGGGTRINTAVHATDYEGQWNHYAFVKNGVTNFSGIYINGQLVRSTTGSTDPFDNPDFLRIAQDHDGLLDDVAIYDQALTTAQIQTHYAAAFVDAVDDPAAFPDPAYATDEATSLVIPAADGVLVNDGADPVNLSLGASYSYSVLPTYSGGTYYLDDPHVQTAGAFDSGDLTDGATHPHSTAPTTGPANTIVGWGDPASIATEIIFDLGVETLVTDVTLGTHTWALFANGAPDGVDISFSTTGTTPGDFGGTFPATFTAADVPTNGHHNLPVDVTDTPARYVKLTFDGGAVLTGGTANKWMLDEVAILGPPYVTTTATISANGASVTVSPDGAVSYDPTSSEILNALADGESVVDTFSYTIGDSSAPALPTPAAPLALWLDAGDIDGDGTGERLADGTHVNIWADKSGNDRHAALSGQPGNDPSYIVASTANGLPAVAFDGNDHLITDYNFDNLGDNYTIITAARYSGTQGSGGDYERLISSDTRNWLFGYWNQSNEMWFAEGWNHLGPYPAAAAIGANDWNVHTGIIGPDINGIVGQFAGDPGADFWKNGVQLTNDSRGAHNTAYKPGRLALGAMFSATQESSVGEVAEILIYDGALTEAERLGVEAYLNAKYRDGDYATVSVEVNGVNDAPVATDDTGYTVNENGTLTIADGEASLGLLHLDALSTGDHTVTADGQTFDAHVENVNGTGWLLVGRGREGWQFDTDGPGGPVDTVNDNLGTAAAFTPTAYDDAIINDLIVAAGLDLTDVEIRLKRAANPTGTEWQEARLRPTTQNTWTWDLDTGLTAEWEVQASILGGAYSDATTNTWDTYENPPNNNDARRLFTFDWDGHNYQQGFSYGTTVPGADNLTTFLWDDVTHGWNHAIPYTEVYIRALGGTQIAPPGLLTNDTDPDTSDTLSIPTTATFQNFDGIGDPYTLQQNGNPPAATVEAGGPTGNYLHLTNDTSNGQSNAIAFDQTHTGAFQTITADFDFRATSAAAAADGFAFVLLPTSTYGATGAGPTFTAEEPNLGGTFGVGFDLHPAASENHVSVHWNGSVPANGNVWVDPALVNLDAGLWHHAKIEVVPVAGGSNVTVTLSSDVYGAGGAEVVVHDNLFVSGLNPYESRVMFRGRTGGLNFGGDLDNIDVRFEDPFLSDKGGLVALHEDGSFSYDPNGQFESLALGETDTDTFTYAVTDGGMGLVPANGRFVRVENNGGGTRRMDIGEIEVFGVGVTPVVDHAGGSGTLNPTIDLAYSGNGASLHSKGAVSGFSQPHGGDDDPRLIDGAETTAGNTWSSNGVGNFVIIDLGGDFDVETVRVHQRNDSCCQDRLKDFTVSVLADDGVGNPGAVVSSASFSAQPPTNGFGEVTIPEMLGVVTKTATVTVEITGENDPPAATDDVGYTTDEDTALSVAATEPIVNLAPAGTASQSSLSAGGVPSRAIDNNTSGHWPHASTTHTEDNAFSWWQVALAQESNIDQIVLHNRSDCCGSRLGQFRVSVFDGDPGAGGTEVFFFNHPGTVAQGGNLPIDVQAMDPDVRGDYIRVAIDPASASGVPGMEGNGRNLYDSASGVLSLAEVQVFGNAYTGLLQNDSDPDLSDTLTVFSFDDTSANGAAISVDSAGGFTYDPNASSTLAGLAQGETVLDTFDYNVVDATTYRDTVVGLGPVAYYTMDSDNVTGNTVANLGSDTTKTATLQSGASFTSAGLFGDGLSIADDSNQRLEVDNGEVDLGTDWTVSAWFNGLHDTDNWRTLARGAGGDHQIIVETGQNDLGMYSQTGGGFRDSGFDLFPGDTQWHHIAAIGNATANTTDFYIDGIFEGQSDRSSLTDVEWIGNHEVSQPFAQTIDEFAVFGRALTADELAALAHPGDQATATITVAGVNHDPTANDDPAVAGAIQVIEGESVTIAAADLLANDTDPDIAVQLVALDISNFEPDSMVLVGHAEVTPGGVLQLTDNSGGQAGSAWYPEKLDVNDGFSTTIEFEISGPAGGSGADGMSFMVQNIDTNQNVGETGIANALTIGLDTYNNGGEISANHIEIFGGTASLAVANLGLELLDSGPHTLQVDYDGATGDISVRFDGGAPLTATVDLEAIGAVDGDGRAYLGFGARTGGATEFHNVLDWSLDTIHRADILSVSGTDATSAAGVPIVDNNDGTYTYDASHPNLTYLYEGEVLDDTFSYTANDGHGGTSTAIVTVRVVGNDPPVPVDLSLDDLDLLHRGNFTFDAAGQSFQAYVDNDGTNSWLLVGRGRQGWEFDADGQGAVSAVNQNLGTPAAFAPAAYSNDMINDLIDEVGIDLTDVEIRLKRAADPAGTAYQEIRWRPTVETDWRWNFDTGMAREFEIVDGLASPFGPFSDFSTNDNCCQGSNGPHRVFTWAWSGHGNQKGFSYGDTVTAGTNSPTNFLWENGTEKHSIPYTEVYIRRLSAAPLDPLIDVGQTEYGQDFSFDILASVTDTDPTDTITLNNLTLSSGDDVGVTINGSVLDVDTEAYRYLLAGQSEQIEYTFDAEDQHGAVFSQEAVITIDGTNPPVGTDDQYSTDEEAVLTVAGDTLGATAGVFTGSDPGEGLDLQGDFVYAVNVGSGVPVGQVIGDATFTADNAPGVSVSAQHQIPTWLGPNFDNGDGGTSGGAEGPLEQVMRSIRWSANPNDVTVDLTLGNLAIGQAYKLQMMYAEACCNRAFDILAEGEMVYDEFNPGAIAGINGAPTQGAVFTYTFIAGDDTLNLFLGDGTSAPDMSPILNALTLERVDSLLVNDIDPKVPAPILTNTLSVASSDGTSALGAPVTVNPDGGFTYDPTNVAAFHALAEGETLVDTFQYTMTDGEATLLSETFQDGSAVNSLADADAVIASGTVIGSAGLSLANMLDTSGTGHFGADSSVPGISNGDNYAVRTTGTLHVIEAGDYTFGVNTDDGARLRIDLDQNGTYDDVIVDDVLSGPHDKFSAVVTLAVGEYPFEWVWFEAGSGAEGELFYAKGAKTAFDGDFVLVGDALMGIGAGHSGLATASVTVVGLNDGPTANDDTYAGHEDTVLSVDAVTGPMLPQPLSLYRFEETSGDRAVNEGTLGVFAEGDIVDITAMGVPGQVGNAFEFDGSNDFIRTAGAPEMGFQDGFTAMAWVRPDATDGDRTIFGTDQAFTNNGLHLVIRNGKAHFGFHGNDMPGTGTINTGTWTHITWRYTAGTGEQAIFVNGQLDNSGTGHAAFAGSGLINLGRWVNGRYFDGLMDEVAVYGSVLTDDQIAAIAQTANAGGVLGNDTDPDVDGNAPDDVPTVVRVDGDENNVGVPVTLASGAVAQIDADGSLQYDPNGQHDDLAAGETAVDTLTYEASDRAFAGAVFADNPIAFWQFDDAALPTAEDSAGTRDGTYNNFVDTDLRQPGATPGSFSAQFDGANNVVSVPHDAGLNTIFSTDYTVEFWMYKDSEAGDWQRLVGKGAGDTNRTFGVWEESGGGGRILYQIYTPGGNAQVFSTTQVAVGQWYHIVATKQGLDAKLYINGNYEGGFTVPNGGVPRLSSDAMTIGRGNDQHTYFPGRLDDVAVYDTALDETQIAEHYAVRLGGLTSTATANVTVVGENSDLVTAPDVAMTDEDSVFTTDGGELNGYRGVIAADAPILHWGMDAREGTTETNLGSLGTSADGVYQNSPTLSADGAFDADNNHSVEFNTGNDHAVTSGGAGATPLPGSAFADNSYAIELWFNADISGTQDLVSMAAAGHGILIELRGGGDIRYLHRHTNTGSGGTSIFAGANTYSTGTWHHLVAAMDRGAMTLYIDGNVVGTATDTNAINFDMNMTVAQLLPGNTARQFDGRVDELAVYDHTLDPSQVRNHYRAGTVALLGNDIDPDISDGQSIVEVNGVTVDGSAVALPSGALVTMQSDGTFTYDPNGQFESLAHGETTTDQFTYSVFGSNALTNGLTFHAHMDDPAGATTIEDASGNNRDGMISGATAGQTGRIDGALSFDGSNDYVDLTNASTLGFQGSFTAMAWVRPDATGGADKTIFGTDQAGTNQGLHLVIRDGKAHFGFYGNDRYGNAPISTGIWTHLIWQYDAAVGRQSIFVNGALDVTETGHGPFTGNDIVKIGRWAGNRYFDGLIDDAAIWNRLLTADEIATVYQHGSQGKQFHDFATETVTMTIEGVNDPVVAVDDSFAVNEADGNVPLGDVTSNDTDPDVNNIPPDDEIGVRAVNDDVTAIGLQIVLDSGALVTVAGDGTATYDAPENLYEGETLVDQFDYTVDDAAGSIASGMVAYWKLDGNALDASPNGFDGTINGNPATVAGQVGNALDFPGNTSTRVSVPYEAALNPRGSFTVSGWARVEGGQGGYRSMLTSRVGLAGDQQGYIIYAAGNNRWQFWTGTGNSWSNLQGPAVQLNTWVHVTASFDATAGPNNDGVFTGTQTFYVDGQQVGTIANASYRPTGTTVEKPLHIGIGSDNGDNYRFNGAIDEVAFWNRPLTATEVGELYTTGDGGESIRAVSADTATVTVTVTGENDPPVAAVDDYATDEDTIMTIPAAGAGATPAADEILIRNPLVYHRLDEASGATTDNLGSIGAAADGTVNGATLGVDGHLGWAVDIGGAGNIGIGGSHHLDNLTQDLTVMAWINIDGTGGTQRIVSSDANMGGWGLGITGANTLRFTTYAVKDYDLNVGALPTDQWIHVAAVMDANNDVNFFLDGQNAGTVTHNNPGQVATGSWSLGSLGGGQRFNGQIDEVAIFNRSLAATDIQAICGAAMEQGLLVSDFDPDVNGVAPDDTLRVVGINGTASLTGQSMFGATVTLRADGSFDYDPQQALALQALTEGDVVTDQFTYTAEDDFNAASTATVYVEVTGRGGIELNMNWLPASEIRLVLNNNPTQLDIYADGNWLQTTALFNAPTDPDIQVAGLTNDDDRLIVDNAAGVINFTAIGEPDDLEIAYDGLGGNNVLEITGDGGPIQFEQYDTAANTITVDPNTAVTADAEIIAFTNVSSIEDDKPVSGLFEILGTAGPDTFDIAAGTVGTWVGGSIVPIDFAGKTNSRIDALADDDGASIADGVTFPGSIDGGTGTDSLDYSMWTAPVRVNLSNAAANRDGMSIAAGTATGVRDGIEFSDQAQNDSSIENVYGGTVNDVLIGDAQDNILGDGHGSDILDGGPGDDEFLLTPGATTGDSDDYLVDAAGNDTVDFSLADDGTMTGIVIDMDIVAWDADGVVQLGVDPTVDEPAPQTVLGANTVTLLGVGDEQRAPAPSPFENVVGSQFDDFIEIDPLGDVRSVDGNGGWEAFYYDGGGSEVIDSGRSLTARGIGSIVYDNIELVEVFNAAARIVDNDDLGFSMVGSLGRSRSEGFLGDERSSGTGTGNNVGIWTFQGVTPGWYRLAATWVPGPDRASGAQFEVLDGETPATAMLVDGTTASGIAELDQRGAPLSFREHGAAWQEFTDQTATDQILYFQVTGHELVVRLPDSATGFVMADAVRAERLNGDEVLGQAVAFEPEVRIYDSTDGRTLLHGFGVENFGTTNMDTAVERSFTVQNIGMADLNVSVLADAGHPLPPGFTASVDAATIAPGDSATLTVTMDAVAAGVFSGTLFLGTNDRDENPFEITLTGVVLGVTPEVSANAVMVDNDLVPGTFVVTQGNFRYERRDTRFVDNDYRYARGGDSAARWLLEFESTPGDRTVEIGATWAQSTNGARNAPFMVYNANGDPLWTEKVRVDQQLAPNDFEDAGVMFESLGYVTLVGGQTELRVEVSTDGADGYVLADAVWGGPSTTPDVAVYDGNDELTSNVSVVDLGYVELMPMAGEQVERTFTVGNTGGVPLTLVESISLPLGFTLAQPLVSTTIQPGESTDFVVRINAAAPGNVTGKVSLLSDDPNENPFEFVLSAQVGVQIVDNDDAGFHNGWGARPFQLAGDTLHVGGDLRYHGAGTGTNWVDWEFTGLTSEKYYRVSATWATTQGAASNAPYSVFGGLSPSFTEDPETIVRVDQRTLPDDAQDKNTSWESLAIVQVPAGETALTVRLTDDADNWVYADAIHLEQVYLPTVAVTVDGQLLKSGQTVDLGTLLKGSSGEESIEVANAGLLPLEVNDFVLPSGPGINVTLGGYDDGILETGESFTVDIDVDTSISTGLPAGAYDWDITFNTNDVTAFAYEIAVAAKVVDRLIVNDGDSAFNLGPGSNFGYLPSDTRYYNGDVHYHAAGVASDVNTVEWRFEDLAPGVYDVSATWVAHLNRATNAPFAALNGGGVELATAAVNQELPPDDSTSDGASWELIMDDVTVADEGNGTGSLIVQLSDQADGYVIADAMMIQFVGPQGQGLRAAAVGTSADTNALSEGELAAARTEATSLWQSTGLTAAEQARLAAVEVKVAALSSNVLGWTAVDANTVWIDTDAAGHGWDTSRDPRAKSGEPDGGSMDLLTVLAHELGHVIGRGHSNDSHHGVMAATLDAGVRLLPGSQETGGGKQEAGVSDRLFSGSEVSALDSPLSSGIQHPASSIQHSAFRTPTSDFEIADFLFARLDDEADERTNGTFGEDDRDTEEERGASEDGLDLWSVLHGLDL